MKKRTLLAMILSLVMCLGIAMPAWAAETYPVYIQRADGEEGISTQAISKGGVTYLPLRALFEGCGASEVTWYPATKTVTAVRMDGAWFELDMRKNTAELTAQGKTEKLTMPHKGYIQNGRVYLPLRFVGEALHCGVLWDEHTKSITVKNGLVKLHDAQGKTYYVDLINGAFYRNLGVTKWIETEYLGNCGISDDLKLNKAAYATPDNWQLEATVGGNYILRCDYMLMGGITHTIYFASCVNTATGEAHYAAEEEGVFCEQHGDKIYVLDKDECLVTIDDKTGQTAKFDLPAALKDVPGGADIKNIVVLGVDGDYIFFRSNWRLNLLMFDAANKKLTNMKDVLITDEVRRAAGHAADDPWWNGIDPFSKQIEGPFLHFVKLENGVLYVTLRTYLDFITVPLEYKYR